MTRLTLNNILFVKEIVDKKYNVTKSWFVDLKGWDYIEIPAGKELPKTVQKFIEGKEKEVFQTFERYTHYIYK